MPTVLNVTWLPLAEESSAEDGQDTAGALRDGVTRFLMSLDPSSRTALTAVLSRTGEGSVRLDLQVADARGGGEAAQRLRRAAAAMVGLAPADTIPSAPPGARAWGLRPIRPGRLPGAVLPSFWPADGFDWPALMSCLERTPGAWAVTLAVSPVQVPSADLPLLRRAVTRALNRSQGAGAAAQLAPGGVADDTLDAIAELRSTGACAVHVSVLADDESIARQMAASVLGAAGRQRVMVALETPPGGPAAAGAFGRLAAGRYAPPGRVARMLPLVALTGDEPTRFPRRLPAPTPWAEHRPAGASLLVGTTASGDPYAIPVTNVTQHLIVTGLQGFGKSTTVMSLLARLWREHRVPFTVIDPEKEEYASLVAALGDESAAEVSVLRPGREMLHINPLAVPEGVDPAAFGATVAEFFDAATRLSESWPLAGSVVRSVLAELYADARAEPPTVAGLYRAVRARTAAMPPRARQGAELEISLGERVQALLSGPNGAALSGGPAAGLDWGKLLRRPAVISLTGYGDQTSRQIAFGLLLACLVEYRRAHPMTGLGHVAVLEEAHLIAGTGRDGSPSPAERGVAAALATLRGYGQGIVLVTQVPGQLSRAITDLFANRISHRLPATAAADAGFASGSGNDWPARQLPVLECGEALVVDAGAQPFPAVVRVARDLAAAAPVPSRLPGPGGVLGRGEPEPIWCTDCPAPCRGAEMLPFASEVRSWLATSPEAGRLPLAELATQAVGQAARAGQRHRLRAGPDLAAKLYCAAAKALTAELADQNVQVTRGTRLIRDAADRLAAAAARPRPGGRT